MRFASLGFLVCCVSFQPQPGFAQDTRSVEDILACVNARTARGLAEHEDFARSRDYYEPPLYFISGPSAKYDTWGFLLDMSKKKAVAYETYRPKTDLVIPTFRRKVSRDVTRALRACDVSWRRKYKGAMPVRNDAPQLSEVVNRVSDR